MDIKDIENLAELSKLELSEKEKIGLLKDLTSIFDYIKQIGEVGAGQLRNESENINILREDKENFFAFSSDLIIGQFPDSHDGFLKVKKIL